MSLVGIAKPKKYEGNILDIMNGIKINPILECDNLVNLRWNEPYKPFESNFAMLVSVLSNIGEIKQVRDNYDSSISWWGFMAYKGKIFVKYSGKHNRPVLFT